MLGVTKLSLNAIFYNMIKSNETIVKMKNEFAILKIYLINAATNFVKYNSKN